MNTSKVTPQIKKSRKTPYTNSLLVLNDLFNHPRKRETYDRETIKFLRILMKLTPRELHKILTIFEYLRNDPYYDTLEKVINFSPDDHIKRMGIKPDVENTPPEFRVSNNT